MFIQMDTRAKWEMHTEGLLWWKTKMKLETIKLNLMPFQLDNFHSFYACYYLCAQFSQPIHTTVKIVKTHAIRNKFQFGNFVLNSMNEKVKKGQISILMFDQIKMIKKSNKRNFFFLFLFWGAGKRNQSILHKPMIFIWGVIKEIPRIHIRDLLLLNATISL